MRLTDIAGEIITEHFDIESGLKKVAVFSDDNDPELRLVEINADALPTGHVEPFVFAPGRQVPIPIIIADVTPGEWEAICKGGIPLPQGWPNKPVQVIDRKHQG